MSLLCVGEWTRFGLVTVFVTEMDLVQQLPEHLRLRGSPKTLLPTSHPWPTALLIFVVKETRHSHWQVEMSLVSNGAHVWWHQSILPYHIDFYSRILVGIFPFGLRLGNLAFFKKNKFIYLFLAALGLRCCMWLSLVVASEGYSSLQCASFSLQRLLLLRSSGSRRVGFSSCGSRALERRLSSCGTWA